MNKSPFFTVPKDAMETILKSVEAGSISSVLSVFIALRWLMNNERTPEGPLQLSINRIAHHAGVSYNTASKSLVVLEQLNLLRSRHQNFAGSKLKAPSVYDFPTTGELFGNSCGAIPKGSGSIPNNEGSITNEVSIAVAENTKEQKKESSRPKPAAPSADGERFVDWFIELLKRTGAEPVAAKVTPVARANWGRSYDAMLRLDARSREDIERACNWARHDAFWRGNFFSPQKLREKKSGVSYLDVFLMKMNDSSAQGSSALVTRTGTNLAPAQALVSRAAASLLSA